MRSAIIISATLIIATLLVWAGSYNSVGNYYGLPLFAFCGLIIFAIQWLAFIPAWFLQTERFFDLTGSMTYIGIMIFAYNSNAYQSGISQLLVILVCVWAMRLGSFLFVRVLKDGSDKRFDAIKPNFLRFLSVWTLQGFWVLLTCSAALTVITSQPSKQWYDITWLGLGLWLLGFTIEVVADHQKRRFKTQSESFINTGLWAKSRHPNYFGEMVLWVGIAIIALPHLTNWQFATLISPVFVYLLLRHISGIPGLEASAEKRWGHLPEYQVYKQKTRLLLPV